MSWFTGWKMRRLPIFLGCIVLLAMAAGEVRGDSVCATLSVGPADIVTLSDSDPGFGSLYTGAVYAGELDWTPVATPADPNPGSPFSTYCIDIFSDIYLGQSYTYNVLPLGSALSPNTPWASTQYKTLLATAVCDIELLWGKYYDCIYQGSSPQDTADRAAAFQIDIWKIIYGKDLVVSPAWGSTGWECYQSKWLSNLGNTPDQLVALDSSAAQDQTMIASVPCPSALAGGIAVCGLMVTVSAVRRPGPGAGCASRAVNREI
jgi:hypothetical protein